MKLKILKRIVFLGLYIVLFIICYISMLFSLKIYIDSNHNPRKYYDINNIEIKAGDIVRSNDLSIHGIVMSATNLQETLGISEDEDYVVVYKETFSDGEQWVIAPIDIAIQRSIEVVKN